MTQVVTAMYVKQKTVEWSEKVVDEVGYFFLEM